MSETIDRRVVEMQFDNRQFESNVKTSMSTLDRLKQSLNLTGASKGLENVSSAAKQVDMSSLSDGVGSISAKFSALKVVGVTALANITNSAVNAGKRIVSALTIDSVKEGFAEYETQMNSVQTILANTQKEGTNVKIVNSALDELNTYADKTIYNFTEMTRNIGTFTAAGVKLDDSVSAIKGIANLAAVSGSTSQQASTAMYQLSQALAAGKVQLMDWNSVVNAGMGGQVFQDALIRTSEHLKTGAKDAIKANGSFRESLTKSGWLTTEVLTQTLDQFATAADTEKEYQDAIKKFVGQGYTKEQAKQMADMARTAGNAATKVKTFSQLMQTLKEALGSGWTTTWRTIIGDFDDAKTLWTDVSDYFSDVINKSSDARNAMLQGWAKAGGRDMAIESVKNAFQGLLSVIKPIKEAFREVFPAMTSKRLVEITKKIRDFTAKLKLSSEQSKKVKNAFKGFFSAISIGINVIKTLGSGLFKIVGSLLGFGKGFLNTASSIGKFLTSVKKSLSSTNAFGDSVKRLSESIAGMIDRVRESISSKGLGGFISILKKVWNFVSKIAGEVGTNLANMFKDIFNNMGVDGILNTIKTSALVTLILKIKKFVVNFTGETSSILDKLKGSVGKIGEIFDSLKNCIVSFQKNIQSKTLMNIAIAIGILAASLLILSSIDEEKLYNSLSGITTLFTELVSALAIINKISTDTKGLMKSSFAMINVSIAILLLASALKKLSSLSWEEIGRGTTAVLGLTAIVVGAAKALSSNGKQVTKGAIQMIGFAVSIKILASICKDLSKLSWEEIGKGLTAVGGLMAEIALFLNGSKFSKKAFANAVGMIIMAGALKIIQGICEDFTNMNWEEIGKGLAAIGGLLTELSAFAFVTGKSSKLPGTAMTIAIVAGSLKLIMPIFKDMANMDWQQIAKGLSGIAGSLMAISLSAMLMPKQGLIDMSVTFPSFAAALKIVAEVISDIGKLSWEQITKGLLAISVSMVAICAAMHGMKKTIKAALTLVVVCAALKMLCSVISTMGNLGWIGVTAALAGLAGALFIIIGAAKVAKPFISSILKLSLSITTLGLSFIVLGAGLAAMGAGLVGIITGLATAILALKNISWANIIKGLVSIAAVFVIIGVSAKLLKPMIPTILSLSGSIALLGLSCLSVGLAISLVISSLMALGAIGKDSANSIIESLGIIIKGFMAMLPSIISSLGKSLKELLLSLIDIIVECVPKIIDGALKVVVETLKSLVKNVPEMVALIGELILRVLSALIVYVPKIVASVMDFLTSIINAIAEKIPELVAAVFNLFVSFFKGVVDALKSMDQNELKDAVLGVGIMVGLLVAFSALASLVPSAMVGVLGLGAFVVELAAVIAAIGALAQIPGLKWIIGEGGNMLQAIGTAIGQFIGGIAGGIAKGFSASMPEIATNLSEFMKNLGPFIEGAKQIDPSMLEGVKTLIGVIVAISAANLIEKITSFITGESSISKFSSSLTELGKGLASFSNEIKDVDANAVNEAAKAAKALALMNDYIPNQGGLVSLITGDNTLSDFSKGLLPLGVGLKNFSNEVKDIDVVAINGAAKAAKALALMNDYIPNEGGLVALITGDNTLSEFSKGLKPLGTGLKEFSNEVEDVNPKNISQAAKAAKSLALMADTVPNQGGLVAWITGDNSVSKFAEDLKPLGKGLSSFSDEVDDIKPKNVMSAAKAAKALAEMADTIPNEGGLVAWFTGDNSVSKFAKDLKPLGEGLSSFSDEVDDIKPKNVEAAANAGKALAEMADTIPNEGGVVAWFTGENSVSKFSDDLVSLGKGLASFSDEVEDIEPDSVQAAANAAKALGEMVDEIPSDGFWSSLFSDNDDVASFVSDLKVLGEAISDFDESVGDIDSDNISAAASAAKDLAGIKKDLASDEDDDVEFKALTTFVNNLKPFGEALYDFSYEVEDINTKKVKAAADAAVSLSSVLDNLPKTTGEKNEDSRLTSLTTFVNNLEPFGEALCDFSDEVEDINTKKVKAAADAAVSLSNVVDSLPKTTGVKNEDTKLTSLTTFINDLEPLGQGINDFNNNVEDINIKKVKAAADAALTLSNIIENLPKTTGEDGEKSTLVSLTTFINNLQPLGEGINEFNKNVKDITVDKVNAAADASVKLANIIGKMPKTNGEQGESSTLTSLTTFISNLQPLGEGINEFNKSVKDINAKKVTSAADSSVKLAGIIGKMPKKDDNGDKSAQLQNLTTFTTKLEPLGEAIGSFNSSVKDINAEKVTAASNVAIKLANIIGEMPEENTDTRRNGYVNIQLQNLTTFTTKLQPLGEAIGEFNAGVSDISDKKVTAAANVASTLTGLIKEMPENDDDDKSGQLENLSTFTTKLQPLGEAIGNFNAGVEDINGDKVTIATKVATALIGLIKEIPDDGKRAGEYSDRKLSGLKSFVDELKPLGTAIKGFNDNVGAIDKTNVTTATNAAILLSSLINQMPENYDGDGDGKDKKTGQLAALTDFISELEPLGEAIQKFNKKVGEIVTDKVETAANAALTLSEIIPNVRSFSLPSDFTTFTNAGKSTPLECLTAFINSLEPLGIAINTFNTNVKSINGKVSMDAAKVAVQLSTVINELPDSIKSSATKLEEPFKKIGSAVKNFYDQSKNVKPTIVKNVASATKDLGQAVRNLPDGKKVSSFSDNISSLGTNMKSFATTVMGIKTDELTDILNSFKTSVNSIVKAAKNGSSELSKAFDSKNSKDDLKSALNNLLKAGINKISKYNSEFEKAGAALTSNLEKGMTSDSKKNSLSKNIKSVVDHALSAITTRYNSFKSAGSYLIEGLAIGLNDTNSSVYNAAYKLGESAAKGVKNGGKIQSPSKLTIESGHYLGKGLIVGMDQISNSVYKKGENLGHKAAMSITSAVANVVDTMNMDMDYQPTIRPVVDLSDVSSGVNSMNKMFGINPSIGVISNVRSISSSMNSNQNGNGMLLSAIDKLNDKMKSGDNVNVTVNVDYTSGENADEIANDIAASLQRAIRRGV